MRFQLAMLLFILTILSIKAQNNESEAWVRFEDTTKQRFGFKDLEGNLEISPIYWDCPTDTFKSIAFVGIDEYGWVCIDKNLNFLFHPFICDNSIDLYQSGLIRIQEKNKMGFADNTGKIIIPPMYDFVTPFDNDYAAFLSGGKYICGEKGIPDSLCENMIWVGGLWGIINKHNDTLIPPSINDSVLNFRYWNLSSLTDSMPNSCFLHVVGKTKTYFIEDVEKSFQIFFTDFIREVERMNFSYIKSVCFSHIKCTYCLLNTQQEYYSLVKTNEYVPGSYHTLTQSKEVLPIGKFIHEDLNIIFSRKSIANLRDTSITEFFFDHTYCDYLFSFENDIQFFKHLNRQRKYYKITAVVSHRVNARITYQEHYEFLKTDHGIKFIGYDRTLDGYGK